MKYAVCIVGVSPVRKEPSDASEMVTQILFGEKVWVDEIKKNWWKVTAEYDKYEGWVDAKQYIELTEKEFNALESNFYASESFNLAVEHGLPITLPLASVLPSLKQQKIQIVNKKFDYLGESIQGAKPKSEIIEIAKLYLNVPYLWGGKSTFGIDCSGFVQQVYKLCGEKLPRDAYQQAELGDVLSFVEEAEPGDLAFFDNKDGKIIHVGIILEGNKIIHAHGKVRIDPLDSTGIFNTDSQNYSHRLRCIKQFKK